MARKKTRKTTRKTARKSTARRGGGPLASLSGKVSHLSSRVSTLESKLNRPSRKEAQKFLKAMEEEVY
jgi:hypothetical protein